MATKIDNQAYREYCAEYREMIPVFHQDWWLDAAVGEDEWQGLITKKKNANKAAILPIYTFRHRGVKLIHNPVLTPYQGPWWAGLEETSAAQQHELSSQLWPALIRAIPSNSSFRQRFHPRLNLGLPWREHNYTLGVRYTFSLDLSVELADLQSSIRRDISRKIRSHAQWSFTEATEISTFLPLLESVYTRQKQKLPFSAQRLEQLLEASRTQQAGQLLLAELDGKLLGGVFLVHDHIGIYILASGINEEGRKEGAFPNLIWHAIKRWQGQKLLLDFCGSMLPGVANNNSAFGAKTQLVLEAKRQSNWLSLINRGL